MSNQLAKTERLLKWAMDNNYKIEITKSVTIQGEMNVDVYDINERHVTGYVVDSLAEMWEAIEESEPDLL